MSVRRGPWFVAVAVAWFASAGWIACTSFDTAASSDDAGSQNEAGSHDDAGSNGDAASDAPLADGAPDATACPDHPGAILCDDFDHGSIDGRWSKSVNNATLTLSQAQARSAPSSLFAEIVPPDGGTTVTARAALALVVPPANLKIRNTYDVYFEKIGMRSAAIGSVTLYNGVRSYGLYILAHLGAMMDLAEDGFLPDGGTFVTGHPFPAIPAGSWARVILDVDFGPTPTVTLTLQLPPGTPATPVLDHVPIQPNMTGTAMGAGAGIDYVRSPEQIGWSAYFDNVVIETP